MDFKANTLNDEVLTPLNKYLADDEITNIDWNGNELWIKDVYNRCYRVDDPDVTANYKISDVNGKTVMCKVILTYDYKIPVLNVASSHQCRGYTR